MKPALPSLCAMLLLLLAACSSNQSDESEEETQETEDALVGRLWGGWTPPLIAGTTYSGVGRVADRSPAWDNGRHCSGGFKPGTASLGKHVKASYPEGVSSVGGYNCRPIVGNASRMSMHGSGRAIDIMIRGSNADRGDEIANYLVRNAPLNGVERIIWRKTHWMAIGVGAIFFPYGGENPHTDHLHVELSASAAESTSDGCHDVSGCLGSLFQSGDSDGE